MVQLSDNALLVLEKRYFKKDDQGRPTEDWEALISRVAKNVSGSDQARFESYFKLLDSGCFLPNSPTLMNAGSDLQQLSACFVLPIDDSMDSIFETLKNAALIHKSGGGTGFSFNRLRPANARVKSTNGVSSGPISFLKVFNAATDAVKQGGTRRGANMAILNVDHPQILEFITAKADPNELNNFNLSVAITEDFMQAVNQDASYELVAPHTGEVMGSQNAREVYDLIVEMAYKNGEPGIVFLDRINKDNPTPHLGKIESTNPCGEQPLLPNEACNLGSINLAMFVRDDQIDWEALKQTVRLCVDFLDDVIDVSDFPLPQIDEMVKLNRKIGLGVMGFSDLLYQLRIPYASEEAVALASKLMEFIDFHAKTRSMEIAEVKGSFPSYDQSVCHRIIASRPRIECDWESLAKDVKAKGLRNATVTTIAPTGTISMILDTSSGVEPQFSLVYVKNVMDDDKLLYVNKWFQQALEQEGLLSRELLEEVAQRGSIADMEGIPEHIKRVFQTAHDITPEWHIRMQAAFQIYTDNAVSKTINFPNEASRDDIRSAFDLAYKLGCKGVTVYRDGSRDHQVLSIGSGSAGRDEKKVAPRDRPEITHGITQRLETGCGHMYVTINTDDLGACEVFVQMGKVGGCASAQLEAIARLSSLALRSNIRLESIIRQLKGIRCQSPMWHKGQMITSCGDAVGRALENFLATYKNGDIRQVTINTDEGVISFPKLKTNVALCPDCGSSVEHTEGCLKCPSCGWSKC
jgi:ribonucleoside-diphosphate reductase alpha chain